MLTPDRQIDRRILLQADSLESAGWNVIIVAMPVDGPCSDDPRVVRIGSTGSQAKRENLVLDAYRWTRSHLPMNGWLMRWMKRMAWRYLVDQESFYFKLFYSTASRYSPKVVVAHDLPMLPVSKLVAEACGARLVYDSHELYCEQEFSIRERCRWAEIEAKYIKACDAVITVNSSIAAELQRRYDLDGVNVIYNAERSISVSGRSRRLHEVFGLGEDKKVLLLQGGLSAGRNLDALVEAMQYVKDASVVLVILGDGLLLNSLKAKAKSSDLSDRVYFHPAVSQKELLGFTLSADGGVIPYQATCMNNLLCTPNKLFEFIATGIPILASDLPELRKMIDGHQIGLVGDTSRPEKLAALINDFFSDQQRLAFWRLNLETVRKSICWEVEGNKLVGIYEAFR